MAILKRACANCRREIDVHVGQRVTDRGVAWSVAYTCPHCGATIEEDDVGPAPPDVREAILAADGTYELHLPSSMEPMRAIKVLREALKLSLEETAEYRKRLPGALATGTHAEMKWLATRLQQDQVSATVTKIEAPA